MTRKTPLPENTPHMIILGDDESRRWKRSMIIVKCPACNQERTAALCNIKLRKRTYCKSCIITTHGMYLHKLYPTWISMHSRCYSPNNHAYEQYGGRGITVCNEWHDPSRFIAWAEANGHAEGLQIDRRDNDGSYTPENCRWVTSSQNCINR